MFEVVIEEFPVSDRNEYPERTVMRLEGEEVHIVYEFLRDGTWEFWDDMGASISVGDYLIFAGILEHRDKIADAAKETNA